MTAPLTHDLARTDVDLAGGRRIPTSLQLFNAFFIIGLTGFGGVLPWARRMLVDRQQWMTDREFGEMMPLAQLLPGPNVANIATILGRQYRGAWGAIVSVFALYLAPTIITICIGYGYARWGKAPVTQRLFAGLMPAATGLVIATVMRLVVSLPRDAKNLLLVLATFVGITVFTLPLLFVVAMLAPLATWLMLRDARQGK